MKFPNSDALTAYIEDELEKGISYVKLMEKFDPEVTGMSLNLVFFPLKIFVEDTAPMIFIPLGTKDNPAGISNTKCTFSIIFDEENAMVFHVDTIRAFLKANYSQLEWTIDKFYEVMGFNIPVRRLVNFEKGYREIRKDGSTGIN